METKKCKQCGIERPLTEFYKDKSFKSGYRANCKPCKDISTYKWREEHRENYNANQRKQHAKNYVRNRLYRYKLTPEEYAIMLENQKGLCAICSEPPKGKRPLAIDHCHTSNEVRGLLCYGCNRAIAILDKPELLQKAKEYLKKDIDIPQKPI